MPDFSVPAPAEPQKTPWLHDLSQRPARPDIAPRDWARFFLGLALGFLFTLGFTALAFQTRDSWGSHRDWVVPTTIPFFAMAGVAAAYLIVRREWEVAAAGIVFTLVSAGLMLGNIARGREVEGDDVARDLLAAFGGVALALAVICFVAGFLWVQWRRPEKVAPPEM
ncbi:MAG: hypothetical protein Kow0010_25400 [Dehalococcoidia bacterium]